MELEYRKPSFHYKNIHSGDLEFRLIYEYGPDMTGDYSVRSQPWLNDYDAAGFQVACHVSGG
jgi:hypothetical protein